MFDGSGSCIRLRFETIRGGETYQSPVQTCERAGTEVEIEIRPLHLGEGSEAALACGKSQKFFQGARYRPKYQVPSLSSSIRLSEAARKPLRRRHGKLRVAARILDSRERAFQESACPMRLLCRFRDRATLLSFDLQVAMELRYQMFLQSLPLGLSNWVVQKAATFGPFDPTSLILRDECRAILRELCLKCEGAGFVSWTANSGRATYYLIDCFSRVAGWKAGARKEWSLFAEK